ncbi:jg1440, partial [Pararge aegeria aegeria]
FIIRTVLLSFSHEHANSACGNERYLGISRASLTAAASAGPLIQSEMTIVNESGDDDGNDTLPAIRVSARGPEGH